MFGWVGVLAYLVCEFVGLIWCWYRMFNCCDASVEYSVCVLFELLLLFVVRRDGRLSCVLAARVTLTWREC